MALLSKKRLIPILIEKGFITSDKSVGYEAFGTKVLAFINVKDMATRHALEKFLRSLKLPVGLDYWPGKPVVQVQVSYFKAWHWDE